MKTKEQKPSWLKSAVISWLGLTADQWAAQYGKESASGVVVNTEKALKLSTVMACTRLVSQTIATLPLAIYEKKADGTRVQVDLEIGNLLRQQPNASMTSVMFWEAVVANALLTGNGFAVKRKIGSRIVSLDPLLTDRLSWSKNAAGKYVFRYTHSDGRVEVFQEDEIFHIPGFSLDGKFGLSVIKYGADILGAAISSDEAANKTFKNGLMPTVGFKFDKVLKPEQRKDFRENFEKVSGALNAGKAALFEGGMEPVQVGINPKDAQLLESRNFSAEEICRWFGVPARMVGVKDEASAWASSSEQINLWFLQYGLRPLLKRTEQAIWSQLFMPVEKTRYYAEFSVEGLLRADTQARAQFYSTALQNGWMNRSTVAKLENLPEIPGGDVYTVQSNLIPLEKLGQTDTNQAVKAALKHWLSEDSDET